MPNKTIYVSEQDEPLYEEAKQLAGEALSSVITKALKEFVAKYRQKEKSMKEVTVTVGTAHAKREQRFVASLLGTWQGFSDDKKWWQKAAIYQTQKGNYAVHLTTMSDATLLTDKKAWKQSGSYLTNPFNAHLFVASKISELKSKVPKELYTAIEDLTKKDDAPIEYLDI